jgi:hypothetical protein
MGAAIGGVLFLPLGLATYGGALGFFIGIQARLTLDGSPDPANWSAGHAADPVYRRGATAIAAAQIVTVLVLAILGAGLFDGR